jgi:hypothetical protein
VREDGKEVKMYRKGKDIRKKRYQIFKLQNLYLAAFVFLTSVFGEKFTTAEL